MRKLTGGQIVEIQVAAYHIRVKARHTSKFEKLESVNGGTDLLSFFQGCFKKWSSSHDNDPEESRIAKLEKFETTDRVLRGRIQVGDYGQACDVIDKDAPQKAVFKKGTQHADLLPFFFRLEIPLGRDEGLFLIEKSRKTSPKTAFTRHMQNAFKANFPDYTLSVEPVMPQEIFEKFLDEGSVQKIEFIRMGLPDDIADILDGGHQEALKRVKTKLVITAGRRDTLPVRKSLLRKPDPKKAISDLYEPQGFNYDNISVTVRLGKNSRKVDLGNRHAQPLYNISDEVKPGKDGLVPYKTMAEAFERLADDIKEGAYASS